MSGPVVTSGRDVSVPLQRMIMKLTKLLHSLNALTELGAEIGSSHNFEDVMRSSLYTLLGTLAIPRGGIARFSARPCQLKVVAAKGLAQAVGQKIALDLEDVKYMIAHARPVAPGAEQNGLSEFLSRNSEVFERLRASIVVPMVAHDDLVGIIFLSEKLTRTPFDEEDIEIINAISQQIAIAFYNHRLRVAHCRKAEENRRMERDMRRVYHETARAFGSAIDLKDAYTKGHSERVARYSEALAREMGITGDDLEYISVAGYLHDIGKLVIDRSIINNPRPLTDGEFKELNRHAATGYEILSNLGRPWQEIALMAKSHHEKIDGTGYPDGLRGDEIPLGSKIVAVADAFDAMMSDRPYRSRLPLERALDDLHRGAGHHFDGEVVAAFCRMLLKEIEGTSRQRVVLPVIGLRFDREAIIEKLNSIIG